MKYKEFIRWCSDRSADGCWGFNEAQLCISIINDIKRYPFWKREKQWQIYNNYFQLEKDMIIPINNKIKEIYNK